MQTTHSTDLLFQWIVGRTESAFREASQFPSLRAKRFAWPIGYCCEAALIAYQRTKEARFLEFVASAFTEVVKHRDCEIGVVDTYRGRITKSWTDGAYKEGHSLTHVSIGGRITYPALEFCRIVLTGEGPSQYSDTAKRFLEVCLDAVDEYADDLQPLCGGQRYYMMPEKHEVEAFNHVHSLVNSQIVLWELTGEERFRDRAFAALDVWCAGIEVTETGPWRWRLRPKWLSPNDRAAPEYTWKAQIAVQAARLAYRAGMMFDRSDMQAIARSFTELMVNGEGGIQERMDPRRKYEVTEGHREATRAQNITGFLQFAEFLPEVATAVTRIVERRPDLFPKGWFSSEGAIRGLAWSVEPIVPPVYHYRGQNYSTCVSASLTAREAE